jgi:hypothetical protein
VEQIHEEDVHHEHSVPCQGCAEKDHQLAEKKQQLLEKDQLIVELHRRIKKLEAEKEEAPKEKTTRVIKQIADMFEDAHYGTANEARREKELVKKLPKFEKFMGGDGNTFWVDSVFFIFLGTSAYAQKKHQETYGAFVSFKKRVFMHFMQLFKNSKSVDDDTNFAKMSQTELLKIACYLADIENESLGSNDCWLAGEKAYTTRYERPSLNSHGL